MLLVTYTDSHAPLLWALLYDDGLSLAHRYAHPPGKVRPDLAKSPEPTAVSAKVIFPRLGFETVTVGPDTLLPSPSRTDTA